jgi:hypothetical protein
MMQNKRRAMPCVPGLCVLFLLPLIFAACSDLDRANPLDPKNHDSFNKQTVLAELFVNDSSLDNSGNFVSSYTEAALEDLQEEFGYTRLVFAQFHISSTIPDPLADLNGDNLIYYHSYVAAYGDSALVSAAVPDVYINGPHARFQGANNEASVYTRLRTALAAKLDQRCYFTIEGNFTVSDSARVSVSARIARLGMSNSTDGLKACFLALQNTGVDDHYFIVNGIGTVPLPVVNHGEIYKVPTQTITLSRTANQAATMVIVCIKDADQNVLQSILLMNE